MSWHLDKFALNEYHTSASKSHSIVKLCRWLQKCFVVPRVDLLVLFRDFNQFFLKIRLAYYKTKHTLTSLHGHLDI